VIVHGRPQGTDSADINFMPCLNWLRAADLQFTDRSLKNKPIKYRSTSSVSSEPRTRGGHDSPSLERALWLHDTDCIGRSSPRVTRNPLGIPANMWLCLHLLCIYTTKGTDFQRNSRSWRLDGHCKVKGIYIPANLVGRIRILFIETFGNFRVRVSAISVNSTG
jgi:hypothetical protein